MTQPKIAEVIRTALGERLVWEPNVSKLCKDSKRTKHEHVDHYKIKGIDLVGSDGRVHTGRDTYYSTNAEDVKDLQLVLCAALKAAGYTISHLMLHPDGDRAHWVLSFDVAAE